MHHSFTKQCVTLGSALVLGLTCGSLPAQTESKPPQKALIQFDGLMARWKSGDKAPGQSAPVPSSPQQSRALFAAPKETAASAVPVPGAQVEAAARTDSAAQAASAPRKALIPPNTIFNRNVEAMRAQATSTPLPPTSLVLNHTSVIPVSNLSASGQPVGSPISTSVPTSLIAQAQLLAGPMPPGSSQPPVIIVMQTTAPDIVNFAPRELSPEVPNDFWPADSRNPLGRRDDHGLFTWPKFAKALASETMGSSNQPLAQPPANNSRALLGGAAPAEAPTAATPTNSTPKALFPASEPATPVQPESKALFGRSEPQQQVTAPAQSQQSRALFAQPQPAAAPAASPSETGQVSKSRALFAFGRNREPAQAAPAPALAPQPGNASSTPAPSEMAPPTAPATDGIEAPPQAPTLTEVKAAPPVEKSADLKWRAKGSPRSTLVDGGASAQEVVPVAAEAPATEAPRSEPVEQVVPASAAAPAPAPTTSAVPATSAPPVARPQIDQPQLARPQFAQPSKGKALLPAGLFGRKPSQPATVASSTVVSQVAAAQVAPPAPRKRANEKALVPGLMAMVTRAKDFAADTETAEPAAAEPPACNIPATHIAPAVDVASRRSYYAPAVEHVVDAESARKRQPQAPVEISHRKTASAPASKALEEEQGEEQCSDDGLCDCDGLCDGDKFCNHDEPDDGKESAEQVVQEPTPPVWRQPAAAKNQAAQAQTARPVKKKSYRRLTLQDLTAGFFRPLKAVNEITKIPFPRFEASEVKEPVENLIAESESPAAPAVEATRVARRWPPAEESMLAADDERDSDSPVEVEVEVEKSRGGGPAVKPRFSRARTLDAHVGLDHEPVLASDDQRYNDQGHVDQERVAVGKRLHTGRRQVTIPVVSLEEVGDESTKDLPAMRIRNRKGASVLIYTGSDGMQVEQAGAASTDRQNPLR